MLLINKAARCIDLRDKEGNRYRLMPAGDAVEVPDAVAGRGFTKNLIASGDIAVIEGSTDAEADTEAETAAKAEADAKAAAAKGKAK